jgi:hemerythrin superfamily protein
MNLYEILHQDHEKVKGLFDQLEAATVGTESRREQLFASLYQELDIHSQAEEKYFYSRLKSEDDARERTLESLDEHKMIKKLLKELDAMDGGDLEWPVKLKILRESVEEHVEMEENELFPLARRSLDEDEAMGIAEDIEAFKEEHTELEAY